MGENEITFTLLDGTVLTGIPKESPEIGGSSRPDRDRWPPLEVQNAERALFVANAHVLLANVKRIFADSRLFLAPVAIQSGMAYVGALPMPCLGGYLEWWLNCPCSTRRDGDRLALTYFVSGSPLSGANASASVWSDGTVGGGTAGLGALATTFIETMRRYREPRRRFAAYSLADVLAALRGGW